jgi:hypothetical protein
MPDGAMTTGPDVRAADASENQPRAVVHGLIAYRSPRDAERLLRADLVEGADPRRDVPCRPRRLGSTDGGAG